MDLILGVSRCVRRLIPQPPTNTACHTLANGPPRSIKPSHPAGLGAMSTKQLAMVLCDWVGRARVWPQVKLCDPCKTCYI